jgi:hypothetical protein
MEGAAVGLLPYTPHSRAAGQDSFLRLLLDRIYMGNYETTFRIPRGVGGWVHMACVASPRAVIRKSSSSPPRR